MIQMKKGLTFLMASACALALSSCADESPWVGSDSEGGINLQFSADGRVMRQSRADDNVSPVVPDADSFTIDLTKADGSYSKKWSGVEGFNRESGFPIGDYTLTASFGDINVEGFDNPYYKGSADVHVSPGTTAEANVVATLANAMVSIRYSEDFKNNFSAYSAAVQTQGHDWIVFSQAEQRPAFIAPTSDVKLNITLTNFQGKQVTIQPAGFNAQPRHHYVVNIGVDGSSGDLKLAVEFDDDVVSETVNVSLGDDLFNSPAPTVTPKGFNDGDTIDGFEFLTPMPSAEFQVFAFGGLKEANLNIIAEGSTFSPAFGKSAQLVNASALLQQQLASEGFNCSGFFKNVDKMGLVEFSGFLKKLPAGKYTIQLQAVDAMTRVSPVASLTVDLKRVELEFAQPSAIPFGASQLTVDVNTNCPDIKDRMTFKAPDENNRMVEATVQSATLVDAAGSKPYTVRYILDVAPQSRSKVDVYGIFGTTTIYTVVPVTEPDLNIETDAFAKSVVLRFSGDAVASESVINGLTFYNGVTEIPVSNLIYDSASKTVTVSGLNPGVEYKSLTAKLGNYEKAIPAFTTELATDVTNGNFNSVSETINIPTIATGGKYTGTALTSFSYQINSSILINTPDNWANVNQLTCYENSSTKNTWFLVPSTFTENGETTIRSVGYNHAGSTPGVYNKTMQYYCANAPKDEQLEKAAGELFLGTYSYNGSASRTDGISWSSRPSTLSFDYKYTPYNGEQGEAYITILGVGDVELSKQVVYLDETAEMKTKTVALTNYPFGSKAMKIKLGFKSTKSGQTPAVYIPSGEALNDGVTTPLNFTNPPKVAANQYKARAIGSELVIDNVTLGYDPKAATNANAKRAKSKAKRR